MSMPNVTPNLLQQIKTAQAPMPALPASPLMPSMPQFPGVSAPLVSKIPTPPTQMQRDQNTVDYFKNTGSGVDQIDNPLLRGIARAGDIAASIFAPGIARSIPGTTLHHQVLVNQAERNLANDQATQKAADESQQSEAQTANLDLQPAYKQQAAALAQEKQHNLEQHQSDVLDQTKTHQSDQTAATLAQHGFAKNEDGTIRPLAYEEMSPQQQAITDLKSAQQEQAQATAALREAQNDPKSAAFRLAQQRVNVAAQNAQTAIGRLGLSTSEFGFNQDKFYNPQPTAAERGKGDLAQSALERVQEMRSIKDKHPDWFGPGSGRITNVRAAIGNQEPDMQRYMSAAQYLSDHSAGVFGGRGKYITEQLHGLTDPHSNPEAIGAALDEAEAAAQGFVKAGAVHGKGGSSGYNGAPSGAPKAGDVVDGYRFKGGDPSDQKNWEKK